MEPKTAVGGQQYSRNNWEGLTRVAAVVAVVMPLAFGHARAYTVSNRTDYTVGTGPWSVAAFYLNAADFYQDVVVANRDANTVSVFLSNGSGGYLPKVDYAVSAGPKQVVLADLNGDFWPEIVTCGWNTNKVSVLMNNTDGTFAAKVDYTVGNAPSFVTTGDFNEDGYLDIVATSSTGNVVSVLLNNGVGSPGTFAAKTDYATAVNPNWIAVADVSHDNHLDLVVANHNSASISVLKGNGLGSFGAKTDFTTGANPASVVIADINGSGKASAITANFGAGSISVLPGNGLGTFGARTDYPAAAGGPWAMRVRDVDWDLYPDLIVSNPNASTVSFFKGNALGTFPTHQEYAVGTDPYDVNLADLNNDGQVDMISTNWSANQISVLKGDLPGGFAVGDTATNFVALDQNDNRRSLSEFLGQWVLLDVGTTWCAPCNAMGVATNRTFDSWIKHPSVDFEYLTLLVEGPVAGKPSSQANAQSWASNYYLERPVLHSNQDPNSSLYGFFNGLGQGAFPTLCYVGPDGKIRAKFVGDQSPAQIDSTIAALAGLGAPPPLPSPSHIASAYYRVNNGANTIIGYAHVGPDPSAGLDFSNFTGSLPGVIEPHGWIESVADSNRDAETLNLYFEDLTPGAPIPVSGTWKLDLTNVVWDDGTARRLYAGKTPTTLYGDDQCWGCVQDAVADTLAGHSIHFQAMDPEPSVTGTFYTVGIEGVVLMRNYKASAVGVAPMPRPTIDAIDLARPYPNPVAREATLGWATPRAGTASLIVLDLMGREVRALADGVTEAGAHASSWDLRDRAGRRVPAGVYFARLRAGGQELTRRLVVID